MFSDYLNACVSEAAEGMMEWDRRDVIYIQERDGDLASWQAAHLANGWTTQRALEPTSDLADLSTREIGQRYEMLRPRRNR
jgi:hypothetical protein